MEREKDFLSDSLSPEETTAETEETKEENEIRENFHEKDKQEP